MPPAEFGGAATGLFWLPQKTLSDKIPLKEPLVFFLLHPDFSVRKKRGVKV
jgi:hypothetical protein